LENKNIEIAGRYTADDEIDLFELFDSLFQQWHWWVGITLVGVAISIVVAFSMPKQYEVTAQVTLPELSDVMRVVNNSYAEQDIGKDVERNVERNVGLEAEKLFQHYYHTLISPIYLNRFVEQGGWLEKIYGSEIIDDNRNYLKSEVRGDVKITVVSPKKPKKGEELPPRVIGVALTGLDEALTADFISQYIDYTSNSLLEEIKKTGRQQVVAEIEKIRADINILRLEAKIEREAQLVKLRDSLFLAKKVGIEKPDSIRLFTQANQRSISGLTSSLSDLNDEGKDLFLMGSEYLEGEIDNLLTREKDDPYISGLLPLIKRMKQLENLSFDFSGVKLYTLDQQAVIDGKAEKPKRFLIITVGSVLSLFIGVFVALFVSTLKRRKTLAA
jgi:chain length determinant protein (polysaccharide antigen chain regulator)